MWQEWLLLVLSLLDSLAFGLTSFVLLFFESFTLFLRESFELFLATTTSVLVVECFEVDEVVCCSFSLDFVRLPETFRMTFLKRLGLWLWLSSEDFFLSDLLLFCVSDDFFLWLV